MNNQELVPLRKIDIENPNDTQDYFDEKKNYENMLHNFENVIQEDIQKLETRSLNAIAISNNEKKQIQQLGGEIDYIQDKINSKLLNPLHIIRKIMKEKFAKITALIGIISFGNTINAQSIDFEDKKETINTIINKNTFVDLADTSLLYTQTIENDSYKKNLNRYTRDGSIYQNNNFEVQSQLVGIDVDSLVIGFSKYKKLLESFGQTVDVITPEDAQKVIKSDPDALKKAFDQIHIEFKDLDKYNKEKLDYYKQQLRSFVFKAQDRYRNYKKIEKDLNVEFSEFNEKYKFYDDIRQQEIKHITDKKYLERLSYELEQSGLVGSEYFYTTQRLNQLMDDYRIQAGETVTQEAIGLYDPRKQVIDRNKFSLLSQEEYDAVYYEMTGKNPKMTQLPSKVIASDSLYPESTALHEYRHESTDAESLITPYAKKLYLEAFFDSQGELAVHNNFDSTSASFIESIKNITELDARKRVFEKELEKFGIRNYNEDFTEKHYKKALELLQKNKLSTDSAQFLKYINEKLIYKIMNTIA